MNSILIEETNFDKARKKIRESKGKKILFSSNDDELNRKILEKENINVLLIKLRGKKDRQKQRESGFNSVMAKIAKKKNVKLGIFLDEILESRGKERAEVLGRVRQNIKLCNKENVQAEIITFNERYLKNEYDLRALALILGMSNKLVKDL
jgi:RNase P/RNase MRP subunit p30